MPVSQSKSVFDKLKTSGFRLTKTRKELIEFILAHRGHWTIQSLANEAQQKIKGVGVATVYRTVSLLEQQNFLTETQMRDGGARYEVASKAHHDHFVCLRCQRIFEFENDKIELLQREVAKKLGFTLLDHRMELYGECNRPGCKSKN